MKALIRGFFLGTPPEKVKRFDPEAEISYLRRKVARLEYEKHILILKVKFYETGKQQ